MKRSGLAFGIRPKSMLVKTSSYAYRIDDEPGSGVSGHLWVSEKWLEKRRQIIARDGSRCRNCGDSAKLEVHQSRRYFSRRAGRFAPGWICPDGELITLCGKCHKKIHSDTDIPVFAID